MPDTSQSPINIATLNPTIAPLNLTVNWPASFTGTAETAPYGLAVTFAGGAGSVTLDGVEYVLESYHFHTPNEHTFPGQKPPTDPPTWGELHIVHKNAAANTAVVFGYFIQIVSPAPTDPSSSMFTGFALAVAGQAARSGANPAVYLTPELLFKTQPLHLIRYQGSFTSDPPNADGRVTWLLQWPVVGVQQPIFNMVFPSGTKNHARPTQPLNGRTPLLYTWSGPT